MHVKALLASAAAALVLAAPAHAAKKDPETRLAERLEGRIAGEPVDCLSLTQIRDAKIYDQTAIVYEIGSTLYVNRPENGASSLRSHDIMVTRPTGNRLCDVDVVEMRDSTGFFSGSVFLGQFVPYRKVEQAS